ncbi:MAG: hypothetical protein LBE16_05110, partial [Clostridiales Family XIII bacterium]|nr:hypothetical protein [Clostridiales Family XIII bacterium]
MFKPLKAKNVNRILALLVVMALLSNVSLFMPVPASSEKVYGENEGTQSLRERYEDIPNGAVMPDGNVLLYYSLWDFDARYKNALYYDNRFDPEIIPLPFETQEARTDFLDGYKDDTWYLLDTVYSMRLMPDPANNPSQEEIDALLAASSFAYVVKAEGSGLVRIILSTKNDEEFEIHIEADEDGKALSASLVQFEEVLTVPEPEEQEALEEEVPEEALPEEAAITEESPAEEAKPAEEETKPEESDVSADPESEKPAEASEPADESPAPEAAAPEATAPAGEADANAASEEPEAAPADENAGAEGTDGAAPEAPAQQAPAPAGEASESESGPLAALRNLFLLTVYAEDGADATPAEEAMDPAPAAPASDSEAPAAEGEPAPPAAESAESE